MLRRLAILFFLLYQAFFLNVVVPGHTRGVVSITNQAHATSLADLGCPCCCQPRHDSKQQAPRNSENCAICNLAAHYTPPPVIDFSLTQLGLLREKAPVALEDLHTCDFLPTYYACGPPCED